MLNNVVLMGRLTADPELKKTPSDVSICSFLVAIDRNYSKEEKKADFIPVTTWRNTAEFVAKYFSKGSMIAITGELNSDTFTDKEGNKRTKYFVTANNVSFCGGKNEGGKSAENSSQGTTQGKASGNNMSAIADDDDLPF